MNDKIIGRNPVLEAIRSGRSVDKILVKKGKYEGSIVPIIKKAKDAGIIIQEVERAKLDQIAEGENHQGVIAYVSAYDYVSVKDILDKAREKNEPVEYTPVAKVTNIANTIDSLKDEGLWIAAADMDGQEMYDIDLKGSLGLVIGSEGEGISRLVREKCDFIASIPMAGEINSLNASVAAGVLMYEALRQRRK